MNIVRALTITATTILAAPLALVATAGTASAQVKDASPSYMVVETETAPGHCKDSSNYYKVVELKKGQTLFVDGVSETWARVGYPPEATVFVRVEEVAVEGDSLKTTVATKLRAPHMIAGFGASWQPLLQTPLPVGTVLRKKEEVRETADGPVVAYRVYAPAQARMFVQLKGLRAATDAEAAAYRAKAGTPEIAPVAVPAPETPKPVVDGTKPAPEGGKPTDLTAPQITNPGPGDATKPIEPVPAPTTLNQGEKNTGIETPAPKTDGSQPEVKPAETPAVNPVPVVRPADGMSEFQKQAALVESLESKLRVVAAQSVLTSEVDELLGEFEKALATETSDRRRQALAGRLEYLRLRQEFRETVRRQEEARAALDSTNAAATQALADVAKIRVYTVIGELQPSTVYDGKQLPLMYRVVSVGTSAPKTLGYIKPSQEWDLDRMLGLVVGVIGDAEIDRSLKLNVITPIRVELLRADTAGQPYRIESAPRMDDRPAADAPADEPSEPQDINK